MKRFIFGIFEVLEVALVAVGAVIFIRSFLVQPFLVSGSSMVPSFYDGDYLLVDELTYHFRSPVRGEVAVFKYPNDPSTYFIKRIVGLPEERVVVKNNMITIINPNHPNGLALSESYLPKGFSTQGTNDVLLAKDEYFVMGDNRSYSFDSRNWGPLKVHSVVGLVRLRLWPLTSLRAFAAPHYSY